MKNRIKQIRKECCLTQTEFGEKIGVRGNTITNYENGLRNPSEAIIRAICREFNVNEDWLRTGKGEMFRKVDRKTELASFFGELSSSPVDFRHRLVAVLSRLDESEWELVEKMAKKLMEEMRQEKADP